MKKIILFAFFIAIAGFSKAAILLDEIFNYTVSNLTDAPGWTSAGTLTTGTGRNIISSALVYSQGGKAYALSGVGKTLNSDISATTDYKSYKPFTDTPVNNGAIYVSFLYKAGVVQAQTQSEVFGLATGTSQGPRLWVGKGVINTSHFRFGVTRSSTAGADIKWGSAEYADVNSVILIVLKHDFATGYTSLYVNPGIGGSEPTTAIATDNASTARTSLNNLWFRSTGSNIAKFNIGGVRVATTWAEIVADVSIPKLETPVPGIASNVEGEGFTANWTTVANATGYTVNVYKGTDLVRSTQVSGGFISQAQVTGLVPNTQYTFKVIAKGNGVDYGDSDESSASSLFQTLDSGVDAILTNFNDPSWGTPVTTTPTSGSYPSSTVNGFNLVKAVFQTGSVSCSTGESHVNRILLDKNTQGGSLEFPMLKTVGEVEIHAATGTDAMSFRLEEWVSNQWQTINTFITRKSPDSVYTIILSRPTYTKLRIANNTGSGLYIYKILSRTLQETIDLTLRSSSPGESEVVFYNLKKDITLNFNKVVVLGSGTLLLNNVSIPLNNAVIAGNKVSIPVQLEGTPSVNKNYVFSATAGCFVEKNNETNVSKAITINFQTLKTVAYPANYAAQIDVFYKNVNSPNTRMDIYYPTNPAKPVPVVINMHGGGWVSGAKEEQGGFNMYFNQGWAVANVEYRMRNEALAPAAVEDVRGAMIYLLHHAQELNIDKNKIIFQGGSAGGHLALIGGYLQNNRIYDNNTDPYAEVINVMAVINKYGASDLMTFAPVYSGMVLWLGPLYSDETFVRSISPVDLITTDTPPTYTIHGDADPTIPYSQSVTLHAALQQAGVKNKFTTVPGGLHGNFPAAYNTLFETEAIQFLTEVIALRDLSTGLKTQTENPLNFVVEGKHIRIFTDQTFRTNIYDATGKLVLTTDKKEIEVKKSGLYFLQFQISDRNISHKILID